MTTAIESPPKPGEVVHVRSRRYLVEDVEPPPTPGDQTLVRLSCLEDDAEGEEVQVLWEKEVDAQRINEADWSRLAGGEFDAPHLFAAYYRTLRWNARHLDRPQAVSGTLSRGHPWFKVAKAHLDAGARLVYQPFENTDGPPLLHTPLDPELATLSKDARKFTAPRSLRDVEPSVNLWLKRLDGTEVELPTQGDEE